MTWEQIGLYAPGTHFECGTVGIPRVNGKIWKDWQTPYKLAFNTNGLNIDAKVLQKKDVAKLIQSPSASNGWETIFYFNDPSDLPHNYAISFVFCPPGYKPEPKEKTLKKDSIKTALPEIKPKKSESLKENIICKVDFEPGKNVLLKSSEIELEKLIEVLKTHPIPIEISGYKDSERNNLKLFEDRSLTINSFLLSKGIDQSRIKYISFGDNEKKVVAEKVVKCFIIIE